MRKLALFSMLAIITCSPAINNLSQAEKDQITTRVYQTNYKKLFAAIANTLENKGYIIETADQQHGLINTDFKYSTALFTDGVRRKVNVRITKIAVNTYKIKLNPVLEIRVSEDLVGRSEYQKIEPTKRHAQEYQQIFDTIDEQLNN